MKKLSVLKFGGGLLDKDGSNFPALLALIQSFQRKDDIGPVVVFSAMSGHTDKLIDLGNSYVHSQLITSTSIFKSYENLAKKQVKGTFLNQFLSELDVYKVRAEGTLVSIDKRFHGNKKAVFLTSGGELPTSALLKYVMLHNGLPAHSLPLSHWPIVTDDNFENATPLFNASQKRVTELITSLEEGKIMVLAGFLGITQDGLETLLGRGGSDLTAVFLSCLLKKHYKVETILVKDISVRSADPKIVPKEQTSYIASLSYNEANKASLMGMKIVQGSAVSMARQFNQPIQIVPINSPEESTLISSHSSSQEIVKCVTGKSGCAVLSINNEKSSSLSNSIRVWEGRDDFIELGVETLETGTRIRDFLFLDSEFLKKHEDRLKRFDNSLTIEYGVGVVTIIGDQMATASGVASLAISALPNINIKRGIFAPRTSQIILVVDEKNVTKSVQGIHSKRNDMNLV